MSGIQTFCQRVGRSSPDFWDAQCALENDPEQNFYYTVTNTLPEVA